MDHQILLQQLGGRQFVAMTGAKQFVMTPDGLRFCVGSNAKGVSKVAVMLDPDDTYSVTTFGRNGCLVDRAEGVYCDSLQDTFTHLTGLHCTLR